MRSNKKQEEEWGGKLFLSRVLFHLHNKTLVGGRASDLDIDLVIGPALAAHLHPPAPGTS
jgi:hypothetical protein